MFDVATVLEALESDLALYVGSAAREYAFIHAGVVGWGGAALVLPGRSMSGKTTLVMALVRRGAHYYSDEFAPLDEGGQVHAYARRPSLRESGMRHRVALPELGLDRPKPPLPVRWVAQLSYAPGASVTFARVHGARAALPLIENSVSIRQSPRRVLAAVSEVALGAQIIASARGDADATADALLRWMSKGEHRGAM